MDRPQIWAMNSVQMQKTSHSTTYRDATILCAHIFRPKDFVLAIIELDLFTNLFAITDSRNGFLCLMFNTIKNDFTIPEKETVSSLRINNIFSIQHSSSNIAKCPLLFCQSSEFCVQCSVFSSMAVLVFTYSH